jgi:HSP20 family protein
MSVTDLIPRKRNRDIAVTRAPALYPESSDPFIPLHREVNRLFDSMWNSFNFTGNFGSPSWPAIDLVEADEEYTVTAELPGVEDTDIEILVADGALILRGEKKCEYQDRQRQFGERCYGRFERRTALPDGIDEDKVKASFRNGVLTVSLPKSGDAQNAVRRIPLQVS